MISLETTTVSLRSPLATAGSGNVWGMSVLEAHDRMWAARGVQVVRTLGEAPPAKGPDVYLLLDADTLLWFKLHPVMQRIRWLKPRALRLRIVDLEQDPYSEIVVSNGSDQFERIERGYRAITRATRRIVITTERSLAEKCWRQARDATHGWQRIVEHIDRSEYAVDRITGSVLRASSKRAPLFVQEHWGNPGAMLDGVYHYADDVWMHESVRVPEEAVLVGPLWIGAGTSLQSDDVVVGPASIPDAVPCAPPRAIDFELLQRGVGRLFPAMRGRVPKRRIFKRFFDICFALAVLILASPLFALIALVILLEDGRPIFFAHIRQTIHGKQFPCYKFRTMCRNAEQLKSQLASENQADGPQFFIEDYPRLLRVGTLLRKLQLDELPQFWNVLRGQMSVVGPRPSPDRENQYCPAWREARLSVRPGVTGLWQVRRTREPETDFQEWIRYDLEYIQHQSWKLDAWIIIQTIRHIIGG